HLTLGEGASAQTGQVRLVEHLGSDAFVHVALPGVDRWVIARRAGDITAAIGDTVKLGIDPAFAHVFAADGQRIDAVTLMRQVA
ncbi:MAG: TOBE domain-containing protein, partial [Rubrivivax sp.]